MNRKITCIICPNGCEISVIYDEDKDGIKVGSISGNTCPKGVEYAETELKDPRRTISSSVQVTGGIYPLASVRITKPVPKGRIKDVMKVIKETSVSAPVSIGDVVIHNMLGLDTDLIITRNVSACSNRSL